MSQEQRVLQMLRRRPVLGVKNYEFTNAGILRYSARIGNLRKQYHITCERLYRKGKATGTFIYKLVEPEKPKKIGSPVDGMFYEDLNRNWLGEKLSTLRSKIAKK